MNNRINELAEQAGVTGYFAAGTELATPIPLSSEMERFAQLIIQECAELTLAHRNDDYYNGWLDYRDEIRRHFGVAD